MVTLLDVSAVAGHHAMLAALLFMNVISSNHEGICEFQRLHCPLKFGREILQGQITT